MTLKFPASGGREALIPTCLPFSKIEYCATSTIQTLKLPHIKLVLKKIKETSFL